MVSHPIREQVLVSLYWPHQADVLCCCCAILNRRKRNRGKKFPHQLPSYRVLWHFFPPLCHYHLFLRWKNLIFTKPGGWNNLSDHHRYNCSDGTSQVCFNGAWMCIGAHFVHMWINMCVIWFAEKKGRIWIRFELVLIWFGEKQAGEQNVSVQQEAENGEWGKHSTYWAGCISCSTSTSCPTSQEMKKELHACRIWHPLSKTVHTKSIREQPQQQLDLWMSLWPLTTWTAFKTYFSWNQKWVSSGIIPLAARAVVAGVLEEWAPTTLTIKK